jgi:hypothetical protein
VCACVRASVTEYDHSGVLDQILHCACVRASVTEYDHSGVLDQILHCYVDYMYYRSTVHQRTVIYVETTMCYVTELQYCTNSKLLDGILIEFAVNRLLDKCYCKIYRAMNCNTGA